jgi:hypothetical protein
MRGRGHLFVTAVAADLQSTKHSKVAVDYSGFHLFRPPAYFALKGTQTKRSATRVRNNPKKKQEAKGDAPGLKSSDVSLNSGSEGPN